MHSYRCIYVEYVSLCEIFFNILKSHKSIENTIAKYTTQRIVDSVSFWILWGWAGLGFRCGCCR